MHTLVIDETSINAILACRISLDNIVRSFELPESTDEIKCVINDENGYILSRVKNEGDAFVVVALDDDSPLRDLSVSSRNEAFARILRCTVRMLEGKSRSIPISWRPYHSKNRLSFQADRRLRRAVGGKTEAGRIVLEMVRGSGAAVYAFMLGSHVLQDLGALSPDYDLFKEATDGVNPAREIADSVQVAPLASEVELEGCLRCSGHLGLSLDEWYTSRLTEAQLKFVNASHEKSISLVGPAGSGKTLALVVKCLRDAKKSLKQQQGNRFLFLSHAASTVDEVEDMILGMEPAIGLELLTSDPSLLEVSTLYSLANNQMRYNLDDLTPISLDGYEGRSFQAEILNSVIEEYKSGDWIVYKNNCSQPFVAYMEKEATSLERRFFLWELLNEFACVLDADNVRSGVAQRERYIKQSRRGWMMHLEPGDERRVVLDLYTRFGDWLRAEKAIGCDQMITDYLNDLDSFRWEARRSTQGYDCVFVDELHLFNRQERLVLRHLFKNPDETPVVFMAYDAKQSPRDTFLGLPNDVAHKYNLWRDAKLGPVDKIELVDVFRYTPEITAALTSIDLSFPGQDLDEEWPAYSGISQTKSGPLPTVLSLASTKASFSFVFKRAAELQSNLGSKGRVAVLCVSNELFKEHLNMPFLHESYNAITSRDEASNIPRSTKKFIFSMPEFVAGLQFDTVLLMEVNEAEVPRGAYSASAKRKFVSQIYLGASRAERCLEFYSSADQGGTSSILAQAISTGTIVATS